MEGRDAELAVLAAIEKIVKEPLADAKSEMRHTMEDLYFEHGVTQKRLDIMGDKVGTVSYTPPKNIPTIDPACEQTALEWLYEHGLAEMKPKRGWESMFQQAEGGYFYKETGEMVPWLSDSTKPGVSTVRLSVPPQDVLDKAQPLLGGGFARLLGGSDVQGA